MGKVPAPVYAVERSWTALVLVQIQPAGGKGNDQLSTSGNSRPRGKNKAWDRAGALASGFERFDSSPVLRGNGAPKHKGVSNAALCDFFRLPSPPPGERDLDLGQERPGPPRGEASSATLLHPQPPISKTPSAGH